MSFQFKTSVSFIVNFLSKLVRLIYHILYYYFFSTKVVPEYEEEGQAYRVFKKR